MQNLQSVTKGILKRVEEVTGKSIQFMRDDNLAVLSTLQMARNGAEFHVMRYRPSNDPIDYFVAFQAPDGHLKLLHSWPPKLPQAGRIDYGAATGLKAIREAASLSL